jgi:ubiquitin-protein ligase
MPRLPQAIWKRRIDNEFAELSRTGIKFTASADRTDYVLEFSGRGYFLDGGTVKTIDSHKVRVQLLRDYPYAGGIDVTWVTPIFHPNIRAEDGKVCIQILNAWSEGLTLVSLAKGLRHLLDHPNPSDPLNKSAAKYFVEHGLAAPGALAPKPGKPRIVL